VLAHAKVERLRAPQCKPRIEWSSHGAGRVVDELEPLAESVVPDDRNPADHVAVAVQVLGGRVEHDVRAKVERALEKR
jgi:hypothetical protein